MKQDKLAVKHRDEPEMNMQGGYNVDNNQRHVHRDVVPRFARDAGGMGRGNLIAAAAMSMNVGYPGGCATPSRQASDNSSPLQDE